MIGILFVIWSIEWRMQMFADMSVCVRYEFVIFEICHSFIYNVCCGHVECRETSSRRPLTDNRICTSIRNMRIMMMGGHQQQQHTTEREREECLSQLASSINAFCAAGCRSVREEERGRRRQQTIERVDTLVVDDEMDEVIIRCSHLLNDDSIGDDK